MEIKPKSRFPGVPRSSGHRRNSQNAIEMTF